MPCHDCEEEVNASDEDPLRTPTKPTGNGGAGRVEPDGESDSDSEDSDDHPIATPRRTWNDKAEYTMVKRWVTGERAEMEPEDIDRELLEFARDFCRHPSSRSFQNTLLSLWMLLCGSSIVITPPSM